MNRFPIYRKRMCLSSTQARSDEERGLFQLGLAQTQQLRPASMLPGVPQGRVQAIEAGFQKTLQDPNLMA